MPRVLILTGDTAYGKYLQNLADQLGPELECRLGDPGGPCLKSWEPEVIVLDHEDYIENTRKKFRGSGAISYIVISESERGDINYGKVHFLPRPLHAGRFVQSLYDHLDTGQLSGNFADCSFSKIDTFAIGSSPEMSEIRKNILRISDTVLPVLIQGETGTGKGVVARALHNFSSRKTQRYMEINCANLPQNLMESELFGHRQGAFTGAWKNKVGRFQLAAEGTVFLDEISELSPYMQAKLLHVLQDGEFSPVGSTENITVDIRILAASNADLKEFISKARFRKDLYYRLAVISITLPPLRERKEDIEILVTHFLERYSQIYEKRNVGISTKLKKLFEIYHWPGNVRELENMIKTLVALDNEQEVLEELQSKTGNNPSDEDDCFYHAPDKEGQRLGLKEITASAVTEAEKEVIAEALSKTGGNRKQAAGLLQVSYKSLLNKIKDYGLN